MDLERFEGFGEIWGGRRGREGRSVCRNPGGFNVILDDLSSILTILEHFWSILTIGARFSRFRAFCLTLISFDDFEHF